MEAVLHEACNAQALSSSFATYHQDINDGQSCLPSFTRRNITISKSNKRTTVKCSTLSRKSFPKTSSALCTAVTACHEAATVYQLCYGLSAGTVWPEVRQLSHMYDTFIIVTIHNSIFHYRSLHTITTILTQTIIFNHHMNKREMKEGQGEIRKSLIIQVHLQGHIAACAI